LKNTLAGLSQPDPIAIAIKGAYEDERLWKILIEESTAQSGPFDGACLICAKAIIRAVGHGSLVRQISELNGHQTEHYGAKIGDRIYDFSGGYASPAEWIEAIHRLENITDRTLSFAEGYDDRADTADDPQAEKAVAAILVEHRNTTSPTTPALRHAQASVDSVTAALDLAHLDRDADDFYEQAANLLIRCSEGFASSRGGRLEMKRWANAFGQTVAVEITDLYADQPGSGFGTSVLNHVLRLADVATLPVLLRPSGSRSRQFYERFGFEADTRNFGFLVRHPKADLDIDDDFVMAADDAAQMRF
jgi:hypothetical protein